MNISNNYDTLCLFGRIACAEQISNLPEARKMAKHFLIRFGEDSGRHVLGKVSTVEILQQAEALLALGDVTACAQTCGRST